MYEKKKKNLTDSLQLKSMLFTELKSTQDVLFYHFLQLMENE